MIPLRLTLRNFMCYRDDTPPIDFAGIQTAVLCGDNGAGKSALLGAMTWALWGEARENVTDEDLITQGENDMSVDFEFGLGDQQYRVLRKRTRRNNKGMITFQIATADGWRDISGHTVRETQKQIIEKLRMDYQTFTNSAFLMQGRADAFTTKTPTERKEILATILGLGEYDRLAEQARAESREREIKRRELSGLVDEMERQLARRPSVKAELEEATTGLKLAEADFERLAAEEQVGRARLESLERQEADLKNVQVRMAQDQRDAAQFRIDVDKLRAQIAGFDALLMQQEEIENGARLLRKVSEREAALNGAVRELRQLESDKYKHERAIESARQNLSTDIKLATQSVANLRQKIANRAAYEAEFQALGVQIAEYIWLDAQAMRLRDERETLAQDASGAEGENRKLVERMNELKARREHFEQAAAEAAKHGKDHCPLCGLMLDEDGRERVLLSYAADIEAGRNTYRTNKQRADDLKRQVIALDTQLAELDAKLKPRRSAELRERELEIVLHEAAEAALKLNQEQQQLDRLQAQLNANDFGGTARRELQSILARLTQLSYDADEHERVRTEKNRLSPYEDKARRLADARENVESARATLTTKEEALRDREARFNNERLIAQDLTAALRDLPDLRRQLEAKTKEVKAARMQRSDLADRKSRAEENLRALDAAARRKADLSKEFEQASYEKSIYDELAKSFGKSGVQAMIIESIMPELQDEANALLGRMTDGRMTISFETQRQAKTTDSTIETLDIKISDDNGLARRYELFSGGEAFRINFAVRIALSKLLARRAGAQLQTLIIDEGFGSQDGQGRERLISAIRSIQDDFEKIFIITHIQELKDEFPSRIEVMRTAGGSVVSVN